VIAALVIPCTFTFAQPAPQVPDTPLPPKPPKSRASVTIVKDGEVVFSKSIDKSTAWRSLDDAINGDLADSVRDRVRTALKDAGKRVNISATGNTMTIMIDDENSKDGKNVVMSFSTDGMNRWGQEFAETFRENFGENFRENLRNGMRGFHFNFDGLRNMARQFQFAAPSHRRFNMDDEDFVSEKAERMADEANKMSREADALRKEAEAMRLEAEAMKKRSEAMRLEAEARKKSPKESSKESSKNEESSSTKKKKQN
jgi:hypothetical protein